MDYKYLYYYTIYFQSKDKSDLPLRWIYTTAHTPYIIKSEEKLSNDDIKNYIKDYEENFNNKYKSKEIIRIILKTGIEVENLYRTTKGKPAKDVIYNDKLYCYRKWKFSDVLLEYDENDLNGPGLLFDARVRRMENKLKNKSN